MGDRSYAMIPAMMAIAAMRVGVMGSHFGSAPTERQRQRYDVKFIDTPKAKGKRAKRRAKGKANHD